MRCLYQLFFIEQIEKYHKHILQTMYLLIIIFIILINRDLFGIIYSED